MGNVRPVYTEELIRYLIQEAVPDWIAFALDRSTQTRAGYAFLIYPTAAAAQAAMERYADVLVAPPPTFAHMLPPLVKLKLRYSTSGHRDRVTRTLERLRIHPGVTRMQSNGITFCRMQQAPALPAPLPSVAANARAAAGPAAAYPPVPPPPMPYMAHPASMPGVLPDAAHLRFGMEPVGLLGGSAPTSFSGSSAGYPAAPLSAHATARGGEYRPSLAFGMHPLYPQFEQPINAGTMGIPMPPPPRLSSPPGDLTSGAGWPLFPAW